MILWVRILGRDQLGDCSVLCGLDCGYLVVDSLAGGLVWRIQDSFIHRCGAEDVCVCVCVCACGLKNGFQRYLGPNPWKLSIHSYGHRDFTDVTKLRILRWGDHPKFSLYALNVIRNDLTRGRKREI
jgi:hypothetical protein